MIKNICNILHSQEYQWLNQLCLYSATSCPDSRYTEKTKHWKKMNLISKTRLQWNNKVTTSFSQMVYSYECTKARASQIDQSYCLWNEGTLCVHQSWWSYRPYATAKTAPVGFHERQVTSSYKQTHIPRLKDNPMEIQEGWSIDLSESHFPAGWQILTNISGACELSRELA